MTTYRKPRPSDSPATYTTAAAPFTAPRKSPAPWLALLLLPLLGVPALVVCAGVGGAVWVGIDALVPRTGPLTVLIVHEQAESLPAKQGLILDSGRIRDYLKTNGTEKQPNFLRLDKDQLPADVAKYGEPLASMWKVPRGSLPWLVIHNGHKTASGPLPKTVDDTLRLLHKYGGEPKQPTEGK